MAIEYYESQEDGRYKDYQNRLNILLSQPDILKKMNDHYMKKTPAPLTSTAKLNYAKQVKKEV
jgi:hypothetical protein